MVGSMGHIDYDKVDFEKIHVGNIKAETRTVKNEKTGAETNQVSYSIEILYKYDSGPGKLKIVSPMLISSNKGVYTHPEFGHNQITFKLSDPRSPAPEYYKGKNREDTDTFWHRLERRVQELLYPRIADFKWKNRGSPEKTINFDDSFFPVNWYSPLDSDGLEIEGEENAFQRLKLIYREYVDKKDGTQKKFMTGFYPAYTAPGQTAKPYDWDHLRGKAITCKAIIDLSRVATAGVKIFYTRCITNVIVYDAIGVKRSAGIEDLQVEVSPAELSVQRMKIEKDENNDIQTMMEDCHQNDDDEERSRL